MKTNILLFAAVFLGALMMTTVNAQPPADLRGAWQGTAGDLRADLEATMICSEKYFSVALYNVENNTFAVTYGGSYRIEGDQMVVTAEFHSTNPELIGKEVRQRVTFKDDVFTSVDPAGGQSEWKRLDDGTPGKLAGAWLITGRYRDGKLSERAPGPRRTMKILSGTRFQWIAYNVDTKEFSGTGGGSYTTRGGKYTENIEFFSRDNSRVGASLTFDFSLEDGQWRHKGSSSKGDPLDEVWTKREKIGL
ncbi:MAG: membrane or secreted protein [Cyclobacteriaceae bacterium]